MSDMQVFMVSGDGYSSNELEWWPYYTCVSGLGYQQRSLEVNVREDPVRG